MEISVGRWYGAGQNQIVLGGNCTVAYKGRADDVSKDPSSICHGTWTIVVVDWKPSPRSRSRCKERSDGVSNLKKKRRGRKIVPEHRGRSDEREVQVSNPNERRHSDGEGDPECDDGDEDQHGDGDC